MTPLILPQSLAALALAACTTAAATASQPPPPPVSAATVELRRVNPTEELTGRVEAISHVEVRPRVAGHVTAVRYREGAEVAAGAVLFTIDARPYRATLARATAELARARARVELARAEAARADRLLAASAIAQAERDSLASSAAQAEAEVQAAAATVELARLDVEFTEVRAPIAGRTGQALVTRGDYVAAGPAPTTLTTLVSVDPVHVYFTGDEQTYLRFASRADQAPVTVGLADEAGFPHAGKVDFVDNRVDGATGTIRLRAVVANPDKRFTPGLYARVRLADDRAFDALLVDDKAVLTDQDRKYVYTLGAGDTVERRDVALGRMIDGLRVVSSGLKAGDRVIVNGLQRVYPGAKVAVTADQRTAAGGAKP